MRLFNPKSSYGNGYLVADLPVAPGQRDFFLDLRAPYNDDTAKALAHLLATSPSYRAEDGFVPLPRSLRRGVVREAEMQRLVDDGVLEMRPHIRDQNRCREFRPTDDVMDAYMSTLPRDLESAARLPSVDLLTGAPIKKLRRSRTYDEARHSYPPLVRQGLRALEWGRCDEVAIEAHLESLRAAQDDARASGDAKAYKRARGRYLNDRACYYGGVLACESERNGRERRFRLVYNVGRTGRISQHGGGLQSCTRQMKAAAYSSIEGMRNYDLESSQARILEHLFERDGIACPFLSDYLATPDAKHVYAARAGVSVDAWKACLYAVCFGAPLRAGAGPRAPFALVRTVLEDVGEAAFAERYASLCRGLAPLSSSIAQWHGALCERYHHAKARRGNGYMKNALGLKMRADHLRSDAAKGRLLAAYEMQGLEAAFITHLTIFAKEKKSFTVLANEHDGLVVIGEIPEAAILEAKRATNLDRMRMVEKALC